MKQSTAGFPIVVVGAIINIVAIVGCSSYHVIPKRFEKQVNKNVDFNTIKDAPSTTEENSSYWVEKCSTPNDLPTKLASKFSSFR
jgi:hypothetical protein